MPFVTYEILAGVFCTTDQPFSDAYLSSFVLTDDQAAKVKAGAQLSVVDGALAFEALPDVTGEIEVAVIDPEPTPEPEPVPE